MVVLGFRLKNVLIGILYALLNADQQSIILYPEMCS